MRICLEIEFRTFERLEIEDSNCFNVSWWKWKFIKTKAELRLRFQIARLPGGGYHRLDKLFDIE